MTPDPGQPVNFYSFGFFTDLGNGRIPMGFQVPRGGLGPLLPSLDALTAQGVTVDNAGPHIMLHDTSYRNFMREQF